MRNAADAQIAKTTMNNQSHGRSRNGTGTTTVASRSVPSGSPGEMDMRGIVTLELVADKRKVAL
jgi:hypothetical protein